MHTHHGVGRERSRVALVRGEDRTKIIQSALETVIDELPWAEFRQVLIKPNLVVSNAHHAITHRTTLETVLTVVRQRYHRNLVIAEGCAIESTPNAFVTHGYPELAQQYGCQLIDLNSDETIAVEAFGRGKHRMQVEMSRTLMNSDCRISLTVPKTHDAVMFTGSIKNMIMAGLVNRRVADNPRRPAIMDRVGRFVFGHGNGWGSDKSAMHQHPSIMNLNLARLAPLVWPHLAVLDGFVAMEGAGPISGTPVDWRVAVISADPLAADVTALELMGFRVDEIGYLHYCTQMGLGRFRHNDITLVGNVSREQVARSFARHPNEAVQQQWELPDAANWLPVSAFQPVSTTN